MMSTRAPTSSFRTRAREHESHAHPPSSFRRARAHSPEKHARIYTTERSTRAHDRKEHARTQPPPLRTRTTERSTRAHEHESHAHPPSSFRRAHPPEEHARIHLSNTASGFGHAAFTRRTRGTRAHPQEHASQEHACASSLRTRGAFSSAHAHKRLHRGPF